MVVKEEKEFVIIDDEFTKKFKELGEVIERALKHQSVFNYIDALGDLEEANTIYREMMKILQQKGRVKIKLTP